MALLSLAACGGKASLPHEDYAYEDSIIDSFDKDGSDSNVTLARHYTPSVPAPHNASTAADRDDAPFDVASLTSDSNLSEMRGGFVTAGGLKFDFGLTSLTSINHGTPTSYTISTAGLNGLLPSSLQQLVQTGNSNQALLTSGNLPTNVLTVVQNTLNGQTIQNQNTIDITVSNLAAYRAQQVLFNQRFGIGLSR